MQEKWCDIIGYEGMYQVSNFGKVRSLDRISCGRFFRGKEMCLCGEPYSKVQLCKNNKAVTFLVHRLVAQAFVPNPNNYTCINHKDEDKHNNRADNLEWCTYEYNNLYSDVVRRSANSRRGVKLSPQHRQALSVSLKKSGRKRAEKRRDTMRSKYPDGCKLTTEQKLKISAALKGRTKSEETKRRMSKPKSAEHIEHMREAQVISHKARKLGLTYQEYITKFVNT